MSTATPKRLRPDERELRGLLALLRIEAPLHPASIRNPKRDALDAARLKLSCMVDNYGAKEFANEAARKSALREIRAFCAQVTEMEAFGL